MLNFEDIAYSSSKTGIPDTIKEAYDESLKSAGKKLWRTTLRVAASGFGKGLLLTAGITILAGAMFFGMGAAAGMITVSGAYAGAAGATATIGEGISIGLATAGNLLLGTGWIGAAILGIGGALGAVSDVRKHQNGLTADMARAEAEIYSRRREENLEREIQQLREQAMPLPDTQLPGSYTMRESMRREAQSASPYQGL